MRSKVGTLVLVVVGMLWVTPVEAATIQQVVDQVSQASYTDFLRNKLPTHYGDDRQWGVEHDQARQDIFNTLAGFGLDVRLDPFLYNHQTFYNVVAVHPGTVTPEQVYVVGAHYDSSNGRDAGLDQGETPGAPGADDNASGVAGVLEAARVLSQWDFGSTLVFIAFDREEQWMIGSEAYASAHAGDDIRGMISMDMIAYRPYATGDPNYAAARIYYDTDNTAITADLAGALQSYGGLSASIARMGSSDHVPFDAHGFDAALLIEQAVWENPQYHMWSDSVDTAGYLDYAYATSMTRGVVGYLASGAVLVPEPSTLALAVLAAVIALARCTLLARSKRDG